MIRPGGWPPWWQWELEFTHHVVKRMQERHLSEVALRQMLQDGTGWADARAPGRFVIETQFDGRPWKVVVEPNPMRRRLVVVTAYAVEV